MAESCNPLFLAVIPARHASTRPFGRRLASATGLPFVNFTWKSTSKAPLARFEQLRTSPPNYSLTTAKTPYKVIHAGAPNDLGGVRVVLEPCAAKELE